MEVDGRCDDGCGGWLRGVLEDDEPGTRVDCERDGLEGLSGARLGLRWELLRATGAEGAALDMVVAAAAAVATAGSGNRRKRAAYQVSLLYAYISQKQLRYFDGRQSEGMSRRTK